jgi:hypothetical protein
MNPWWKRLTFKPMFIWYDLWIGIFIDKPKRHVYIILFPTLVLRVTLQEKHYHIIGYYYKDEPIGCCSERGKADVLEEEPGSTFIEVDRNTCTICNEEDE